MAEEYEVPTKKTPKTQGDTFPIIDKINALESQINRLTTERYNLIGQAKESFHAHVQHLLQNGTHEEVSQFVSGFYWSSGKAITVNDIRAALTDMKIGQYILPTPVNAICSHCKEVYTISTKNWEMYLNAEMNVNWRGICPDCKTTIPCNPDEPERE